MGVAKEPARRQGQWSTGMDPKFQAQAEVLPHGQSKPRLDFKKKKNSWRV